MTDVVFQSGQILYLACDQSRLYTEVIDILTDRQLGWVRPLLFVTPEDVRPLAAIRPLGWDAPNIANPPTVPDLIWPLEHFHPALDTDFLDLVARVQAQATPPTHPPHSAVVSQFTRRLWEVAMAPSLDS